MKKNINFFTVLSSFVWISFLMSCTSPSSSGLKEIVIDPSQTIGFYDLAEDVEPEFDIFALETTDSCLVGGICRIIYTNDLYYILDNNSVIFIFNPQGKFVSKLDKKGRGPDEYVHIRDFTVVGENIWLYDEIRRKFSCYDENLNKTEDVETNTIINKIACAGGNIYGAGVWFGIHRENFQIIEYNTLNKELKKLIPYPQNYDQNVFAKNPYIPYIINQLAPLADSCLFVQPYCDTLFQVGHGTVTPRYKFRFTERYIDKQLTKDEWEEESKKSMIIGVSAIYQTPASILILYAEPEYKFAIFNKETGIAKVYYVQFVNSYLGNLGIYRMEFTANQEIIAIYPAVEGEPSFMKDRVKNPEDRQKIENAFIGLTEDSNPVILKYKLKKNSKL